MATYLIINFIVMAGLVPAFIRLRKRIDNRWWLALAVLLVLTALFDNLIVGFGIVGYTPSKILGLKIGVAPVEDFFYAVAAMVLIPALWERTNE